jgi:hypothetical protein
MGADRIRYLLFVCGRWRWRPTKDMRALGFRLVTFGRELTPADKARAIALNDDWDKVRRGVAPAPGKVYPAGSVGHGYKRVLKIRAMERAAKGVVWTKEQAKRDDWPRAWRWIEPVFGDCDPKTVDPERLLELRTKVVERISATEGHRVIKVWRAMWKKLQAFGYCGANQKDPSLVFANTSPDPRQDVWAHPEVTQLVDAAWQSGKTGLAALMAVIWDSMLSPGDARTLTPGQMDRNERGAVFFVDRAKTGRAAAGTLTPWSEKLLSDYLASLGAELLDNAPIFRTAGSEPGPKGGRRWLPQPYSTSQDGPRLPHRVQGAIRKRRDAPACRHAQIRRGRGRRRRRLACRSIEQDGEYGRRLEQATQDLQPGERHLSAPIRRGARARARGHARRTEAAQKCHNA